MKMEIVDQEEDDGKRIMKYVGRVISKHICSSRANDESPTVREAADRSEKFEDEENTEAGDLKTNVDEELKSTTGVNAEIDNETDKTVKVSIEVNNVGVEVDKAGIARIQTLQEAVSHGLRQPQILDRLQQQVLPQPSSVVRWERFLPQHQLRVLLVEDDDATRHVVTALLRNCSYEVTSAENGLVAWEFLMDINNHVDLVLTEVMMPCLSGIGLLSRIMNHAVLKHIPVIMMSSHDSMGVVFKCLSKGAVDFLVKPVRKNELKNLWQHIWRRCHSSSGSGNGSGSGSHNQKIGQTNGVVDANNSSSNEDGNNTSSELNIGGGSDNGSGTQSSWIKKAPEVDSSNRAVDLELTEHNAGSNAHTAPQMNNDHGLKENPVGEDVAFSTPRETVAELTSLHLENGELGTVHRNLRKSANLSQDGVQSEGINRATGRGVFKGNSQMAMDLGSDEEQQADSEDADYLLEKHASNSPSSKDKNMSDSSSPSMLELSLKRPRHFERNDGEEQGRVLLNHSHSSAFSRYNATGNHTPQQQDICGPSVGSGNHVTEHGSCVGSSYPSLQTERLAFSNSGGKEATTYFNSMLQVNSNQESNIFRPSFGKEEGISGQLVSKSGLQMPPPGSHKDSNHFVRSPYKKTLTASGEKLDLDDCVASYEHSQGHVNLPPNQKPQFHHHYRHHHHHHHIQHHYHHHYQEQNFMNMQQEDQTVTNMDTGGPGCGSSNVLKQAEGNNGQSGSSNGYGSNGNGAGSLNGSATGSNNPSNNLQNAGQVTMVPSGANVDGDSRLHGGQGLNHPHGILPASDQCRSARREAALNKFRQKRKELCFEKKVRYQSRKKLAEQRPRVRGQFVKQSVYKATTGDPEQTAVTQTNNYPHSPKT